MELVAAFVTVLAIGIPFGCLWGVKGIKARQRARASTIEQYTADFEHWKRERENSAGPFIMALLLCIALGTFAVLYELIKHVTLYLF